MSDILENFSQTNEGPAPAPISETFGADPIEVSPEYDAKRAQTFSFLIEDDAGKYRVSHTFGALAGRSNFLVEFDNERSIEYLAKGKQTDITPTSAGASINLYNKLIESVDGYGDEGEELPPNWKDLVPADDKVSAISDLLHVEIVDDEDSPVGTPGEIKRRAWGGGSSTKTIKTLAYFNGRECVGEHTLKPKTAVEVMAYDRIKGGVRIGKNSMSLKPQMKQKGELYDKMIAEVRGYAGGDVPLHHKALVITTLFDTETESTTKKSSK